MRSALRYVYRWSRVFGFDPRKTVAAARFLPRFLSDYKRFSKLRTKGDLPFGGSFPVFDEYAETAGAASGHYFHMDLWAARRIHQEQPERHLDIGSRLDGFIAHLLVFRTVDVLDIRPLENAIPGLNFIQGDATKLPDIADGSVQSLSCLHAAEHFGLGRYGDPIDPSGYRHLLRTLSRILAPGGRLYFAVPIGRERIEFNAQRVFDATRIVREMEGLDLVGFDAVNDKGDFVANADIASFGSADIACGLFEFSKPGLSSAL